MRLTRRSFLGTAAVGLTLGADGHPAADAQGSAAVPGRAAGEPAGRSDGRSTRAGPPADRFDPWVEVDPEALAWNVEQVRRLAGRPILAVLKNNAYGLDIGVTAPMLEPMGAIDGFAVVRVEEAIALRDAGIRKPVLLMARVDAEEAKELLDRSIELAVYADDDAARLGPLALEAGPVPAHVYVDTGMSRMGIPYHRALPFLRDIVRTGSFRIRGTFMAFTEDREFDPEQLRRFTTLAAEARAAGFTLGRLHAASSNGVFHLPDAHLDLVRPGIALYGAYPSRPDEESALAELRPAFRLKARVVRVEQLRAGDSVSYGRRYIAAKPVWIATLPVGHADGYPRRAVEGARVLVGNRLYRVIGAVSASHAILEVGDEPTVRIGDVATLIGPDDPAIHPNAIASTVGVSVYDLLMHLNPTLPRYVA